MQWKIAVSILLKLLIGGNENSHTTDAPWLMCGTLFLKCKQHTIHDQAMAIREDGAEKSNDVGNGIAYL